MLGLGLLAFVGFRIRSWYKNSSNIENKEVKEVKPVERLPGQPITWLTLGWSTDLVAIRRLSAPALMPHFQLIEHNLAPLTDFTNSSGDLLLGSDWASRQKLVLASQTQPPLYDPCGALSKLEIRTSYKVASLHLISLKLLNRDISFCKDKIEANVHRASQNQLQKKEDWQIFVKLIGVKCSLDVPKQILEIKHLKMGQIVAIQSGETYRFGMVADKINDHTIKIIDSADLSLHEFEPSQLWQIENCELHLILKSIPHPDNMVSLVNTVESMLGQELPQAEKLHALFDAKIQQLNDIELACINKPFPIIWASTTIQGSVERPCLLGEDIWYAYTSTEKVESLRPVLKPYNVEVRDIKELE